MRNPFSVHDRERDHDAIVTGNLDFFSDHVPEARIVRVHMEFAFLERVAVGVEVIARWNKLRR